MMEKSWDPVFFTWDPTNLTTTAIKPGAEARAHGEDHGEFKQGTTTPHATVCTTCTNHAAGAGNDGVCPLLWREDSVAAVSHDKGPDGSVPAQDTWKQSKHACVCQVREGRCERTNGLSRGEGPASTSACVHIFCEGLKWLLMIVVWAWGPPTSYPDILAQVWGILAQVSGNHLIHQCPTYHCVVLLLRR